MKEHIERRINEKFVKNNTKEGRENLVISRIPSTSIVTRLFVRNYVDEAAKGR